MINSFKTLFEARERKFQQERLFRGESVDLVAKITTDGVLDTLSSYSISGVYQPTDDLSGPFYPMDAEIVDGEAILHWTNDNDFGRNAYNVWGLLTKDGKAAYPICWRLMFAHSPSYPLSSVDPIPRTIDFSQYELLNAPWVELSALGEIEEQVVLSALQAVDGRYLPLSGSVMEEDATIGFPVSEDARIKIGKDGFQLMDLTTVETEAMSGWCWWSIPDPVPDYEIQWYTETEIANWSEEHPSEVPPWQNPRLRLCATKPASTETTETEKAKFQIPTDEEGDKTLATREWTQEKIDESSTSAYLPLSGGYFPGANKLSTFDIVFSRATERGGNLLSVAFNHGQVAIGQNSKAGDDKIYDGGAIAIGGSSLASEYCSIAIGAGAKALADRAIQIGQGTNSEVSSLQVINWKLLDQNGNIPEARLSSTLTAYAQLSDIPEVPTDLSAFENSPGFATSAYVQEYVAEHAGTPADMSACLSSEEFSAIEELANDGSASLSSIIDKIDEVIRALKRVQPEPPTPVHPTYTRVVYTDNTTAELDLTGNVTASSIPNINSVKAISFGTDVTSFANQLLTQKSNLLSIEVPSSVVAIPDRFANGLTDTGSLCSLVLPDTITSIGTEAFRGNALTSITLPTSLTSIGNYAFTWSKKMEEIHIGPNLQSIGTECFCYNMSLREITVDPDNQYFSSENGMLLNKDKTILEQVPITTSPTVTIPDGVTRIKQGACNNLSATTVVLPSTLTTIDNAAFVGSSAWSSLTIPSSVTSIGQYQFSNAGVKQIVMEGKTKSQVQAMSRYPWSLTSGSTIVCTDGTITR